MKKIFFLFILFYLTTNIVSSQDSCNNLDFENGNFNSWKGETGFWDIDLVEKTNLGIIEGSQTIMKVKEMDINTCGNISVVAPGGLISARLGNDRPGQKIQTLSYTLNITEANSLFIYKYAVVLQDPGHSRKHQPYFKVNVFNEKKELIDPDCGSYKVVASSKLPGFKICDVSTVVYKDWTTVGLNLSPYIGQKITIEFKTGDCALGEHFGYAYVDAYCSSLKIGSTYCTNANGVTLTAPIGFEYLWDTGETTQSINVDNPIDGKKYTCQLLSVTGCKVDISTVLVLKDPIINFEVTNACDKKEVVFKNKTLYTDNSSNSFHWDFGDGTTSTIENPMHIFPAKGNYNVTFGLTNSLGCKFSITRSITINVSPEPHLIDGSICFDSLGNLVNSFTLNSSFSNNDFNYQWFLNGKKINDAAQSNYVVVKEGEYSVIVTDGQTACSNKAFATVTLSKMASDFHANVNEDFAETSSVNVKVIGGTGPFLFQLDDTGFQESNIFNKLSSGNHIITVKDEVNCTLMSKQIIIMSYPKFFTPNNDGFNDYWNVPNYQNFFEVQIYIFDRYGKFIKEITPLGMGWDGTYSGTMMPASDYWFTMNYKEIQSGETNSKTFKAHFSLKR
jgi:gliding motility-associated-like protein